MSGHHNAVPAAEPSTRLAGNAKELPSVQIHALWLSVGSIIKGPHSLSAQEAPKRPNHCLQPFSLLRGRAEQRSLLLERGRELRGWREGRAMASLPDPSVYYPTPSSNAILRAHPSSAAASKGSFGPVFAVLAVISFLAVAACVVGRLCGRRLSRKRAAADQDYYGSDAVGGDLEKGFEVKYPAMKPMASSRAMIHDIDDGFEIKFAPGKPAAWKSDGGKADTKGRQQHHGHHQPQLVGMMPKGYAVPKEYAGFRYPADAVVRQQGQIRGGAFIPAKPSRRQR